MSTAKSLGIANIVCSKIPNPAFGERVHQ